jgi:hypothetical protein
MGIVVNRLPKPEGAGLGADRITGTDERQKSSRNRQEICSHFAFSEAQIGLVIVHSYQQRGELKHLTPIGQAGFPIARRARGR